MNKYGWTQQQIHILTSRLCQRPRTWQTLKGAAPSKMHFEKREIKDFVTYK